MLKEYQPQFQKYDSAFGAWLDEQVLQGMIDIDRSCFNQGESLQLIGRRILHNDCNGFVNYERFATAEEAEREYDSREFPDEYDATITEDRSTYNVSLEGSSVGTYDTRDDAEFALAKAMVEAGVFCDSWFFNDRGNYFRIDDDIRAYHDEGGDKMHPKFDNALCGAISETEHECSEPKGHDGDHTCSEEHDEGELGAFHWSVNDNGVEHNYYEDVE